MSEKLIPVNIVIADRSYRLKIDPEDEEVVRKTLKVINDKIVDYRSNFSGKDMQDYVSMVLLWFATEQQKPVASNAFSTENNEALKKMQDIVDKALAPS